MWRHLLFVATTLIVASSTVQAEKVYPLAILPFQERGREASELGAQVTDLMFANLVANPDLYLVDREDLTKVLDELELSRSGLVNPEKATQVGHLTGAKVLVTGSVLVVGENRYVVAKIIGVETTRVLGASVKGANKDELDALVVKLAEEVGKTVKDRGGELVAAPVTHEDQIALLKKKLGDGRRPTVFIDVSERHVGQVVVDPAAETELALFCRELGFTVIDPDEGEKKDADLVIAGEGFSEFAARHGNLISVKARLEVKAVDPETGQLVAIDRQTTVAVDLTEQIAGKTALQNAAADLATRLLPAITKKSGKKKKD